ncbi:tRNA (guanosine(37)-N1)-methyltransferase TrmD [Futiania mangrovi]|uniref:tRNA (guanine-N(1)-)-methyltransferase n=1 Tax=Futiania mangrovi TaxID=2959716 RepID=A0A9J6PBP4_9PROT|nr:tRNA (guanosine(37)-N1)-methyltransferase TrmD [Futiania mangrovii]MCP1336661.1 tRNA (guanosine(37)-N1)-methyltransferase TrmD [Futiania mangrovii]
MTAPWRASVLTLYPEAFPGPLGVGVVGKGRAAGKWLLETVDIRAFSRDKHRSVDDTPAGGGPGMVMRPDVLGAAVDAVPRQGRRRVLLSPRGRRFDQDLARAWVAEPGVILVCGRFEGVDERVLEARGIEEVSLFDAVLAGGEVAAMAVIEACARLLPGVLGEAESLAHESFEDGLLEHPHYTRPQVWDGRPIPEVLTSGHHANIAAWRRAKAEEITRARRPDLWTDYLERTGGAARRTTEGTDR